MCRLGEAATFCWRLERVGSTGVVADVASLVPYEAVADSDAWAPAAPRVSYVTLPSQVRVLHGSLLWILCTESCGFDRATRMA